jgi:membrane-anchored mycosin MYCP
VLAFCLAFCLVSAGTPAAGSAPASGAPPGERARRCALNPAPAPIIADVPWPQQRYDLETVSQITDGSPLTVAVVDSGVDATHPQLSAAVGPGADMLDRGGDGREDCVGHGTAVASVIAARPAPGSGLRGVAPGARILPVRVNERLENGSVASTAPGSGDVTDLAAGIRAAVAGRPKPAVINVSISTTIDHPALRAAIQAALDADVVVVAAAGNRHELGDPAPYPASYPGVVGVGAVGADGVRVPGSQVGSYVDLVAPGDHIVGAAVRHGHLEYQGTSFATPFVAATAALVRARWPQLRQAEVVLRLLATADPAPGARPSREYGYGVVNPIRALTEIVVPRSAETSRAESPGAESSPAVPRLHPDANPDAQASLPLGVASILALAATAIAMVAAAAPLGRARRWRPGLLDTGRLDTRLRDTGDPRDAPAERPPVSR